jgi:hypothetical protein
MNHLILNYNKTIRVIMSKAHQIQNFWVWSFMIPYRGRLT